MTCTYRFTGPAGEPVVIEGLAAMKAYLAEGGLEFFGLKGEQSSPSVVKFSASRAAEAIRQVARDMDDDFFRLPKTDATDMPQIVKDLARNVFTVKETPEIDPRAAQAWMLSTEGEKGGKLYRRSAYNIRSTTGRVWVNVAGLESGDEGGRIYQIAGAYAHNNGLQFIGDPDGITEAGKRRRLENMIGLALKYGHTRFLAPHESMQGWNRLVWNPRSDDNLLAMLQASYNFVSKIYPEIKDVEFSLESGRFRRAGADLGRDDFEGMASELRGRLGADAAGAPGSGTLRLAALYRSLVPQEDPEGRMGVLLADGASRAELIRALGEVRFSTQRLTPEQRTLTEAPQFGEWFGNSKMRARDGTPLLFMHGTPSNFEAFSSGALGSSSPHASAGLGHFFTRDRETARRYAQGGTVLEGWLRMERPYVMQLDEAQGFENTSAAAARRVALQGQGYDGAVILDDQGALWSVVTFEPWQFKSTDNNGAFDEFDDRFRFSRNRTLPGLTPAQEAAANRVLGARRTWADRWQAFKQDWAKNLKQGIFDQFMPLRELDPRAYMLARLSKGGDSTLEALMLYGKLRLDANGATDVEYTRGGGMQGFASKMSKLKGEHERFMLWVAAQRADRLMQIGLENLWTPADIAELRTLDQGNMADGTARAPLYAQALQDLNEFNDNVLEIAEGSGLIDPATRQMYAGQPYVPFYRLQEEGVAGFGVKAGLVNQYAWKKLKGGTQKLNEDLLANLLHNWSHLITAAAKNRAAKATLDAATALGIANEVPAGAPGKGFVSYKDAGQERKFAVSDPHVFDAVTALEYAGLGPWAKPLVTAKHWLTIGVTANPTFKLRNLMRDSISAIGQASLSYNPAKNVLQGWGSTAKESETRAHMLAAGGMIRFGSMLDGQHSQRAQDLINSGVDPAMILDNDDKIKTFWKRYVHPALAAYNELGDRTEQVNRAALYDQLRARGMDHMEASYWARDMMDFSMHGKWTAIRGLTQVLPFMNARLQGLYKLGRAGKDDIRRLGTVLSAVSLFSLGLLFAAKGDDDDWKDWQARTEADRNNYWWFKVGGHAFRIPKPFEIGAVGTIAERGYEIMTDDEMTPKRFGKVMSQIVLSQLSMNPTPQLFKPMMDIYANRDAFTGADIEGSGMEKLRKEDRYDERTSEVARLLGGLGLPDPTQLMMGRWDTLSPKQVDYLARGYFSWLATATTVALDFGIRPMLDRGERPAMRLKDAFIVGNFAEELPANGSRYVQRMYDQAKEIEEAYNSWHSRLKTGDQAGAQEVLEAERGKIALHGQVEMVKRATSLVNVQIRKVEADKALSAEEKRIRLDALYARKNQLAQGYRGF